MTTTTRPIDPAACRVVLTRGENGALRHIGIVLPQDRPAVAGIDAWGDEEIDRLLRLAREEEGSDPHDDKLPSDRALICAALRDLGIPIAGEEEDDTSHERDTFVPKPESVVEVLRSLAAFSEPDAREALEDAADRVAALLLAAQEVEEQHFASFFPRAQIQPGSLRWRFRDAIAKAKGGASPAPEPATLTIGITLDGGLVHGVWSEDASALRNVRVVVLDFDTEGADDDEITLPEPGASRRDGAVISSWEIESADARAEGPTLIGIWDAAHAAKAGG